MKNPITEKKILAFLFSCVFFFRAEAQNIDMQNQNDGMKSYLGFSCQFTPRGGSVPFINFSNNAIQNVSLPSQFLPRIEIGGLYFKGRADLYVSIPLCESFKLKSAALEFDYSSNISTGARFYPAKQKFGKLRPFFGINWCQPFFFEKQLVDGSTIQKNRFLPETGFSFLSGRGWFFQLQAQCFPEKPYSYYVSKTEIGAFTFPSWSLNFSIKKLVTIPVNKKLSGTKFYNQLKIKNKLDGLSFSFGLSSAITLGKSSFILNERPFLEDAPGSNLFPDLGLSYYFWKPDLEFRVCYRPINIKQHAFGVSERLMRNSFCVEGFKFICNVKGFAPFVGAGYSYDRISFQEKIDEAKTVIAKNSLNLALIAGWEIRPNNADWLIFRTNLRYSPFQKLNINGDQLSFRQMEINFIQVVIYPARFIEYRKLDKK